MAADLARAAEESLSPDFFGKLIDGVYYRRLNPVDPPPIGFWDADPASDDAPPCSCQSDARMAPHTTTVSRIATRLRPAEAYLHLLPKDILRTVVQHFDERQLHSTVHVCRSDPIPWLAGLQLAALPAAVFAALPEPYAAAALARRAAGVCERDFSRVGAPFRPSLPESEADVRAFSRAACLRLGGLIDKVPLVSGGSKDLNNDYGNRRSSFATKLYRPGGCSEEADIQFQEEQATTDDHDEPLSGTLIIGDYENGHRRGDDEEAIPKSVAEDEFQLGLVQVGSGCFWLWRGEWLL